MPYEDVCFYKTLYAKRKHCALVINSMNKMIPKLEKKDQDDLFNLEI